ncbi:cytochrome c oxidase assembly protein [Actinoplanes sp. KI2]|uniref:cytochrome c oxidase assembly protein n=1 Tax=Actinoplanes sp. KI2 TaxID=2983315 RepID=UPI0021D5FD35|nr:cytochrome c oxidase assembly protein [Actinoplanes sp. KI2]MCU7730292.1 cytochrome c oxidase assembly protein [Actinoplanes sp. KI2]
MSALTGAQRWADLLGVLTVAGLAAAYGRGVHELWARRGAGAVVPRWRAAAFGLGLLTLLVAQQGPVHEAAERSAAGHMAQHMLLMLVGGPLLAAGGAALPLLVAAPRRIRAAVARLRFRGRWLRRPMNTALLTAGFYTVVLWFWHLPSPYVWVERNVAVHGLEHLSLVAVSWVLWSTVVGARAYRLSPPVGLLLLFASGMPAAALGAVLTLAAQPIYPGVPLADQQLAGLVMWVPMDVLMLLAAVVLFLRWMSGLERRLPAARDLLPAEEVPT